MLLGTLGASLGNSLVSVILGNVLAGKGMNRAGEGYIRADYGSSLKNKDF